VSSKQNFGTPLSVKHPISIREPERLHAAAHRSIAACSGDAREAVKAKGYARGKLIEAKTLPRARKDWCD